MTNKFHFERPNQENRTTFSEFLFVPRIFQWDEPKKRLPFTSQQKFQGICGKKKKLTTHVITRPMERNPDSGIRKFVFVESGIQENFACGIRNPRLWNPELTQRIRNLT